MTVKWTYKFGGSDTDNIAADNASLNLLLGRKGANLAELTALGLPVPDGFTISTLACAKFHENQESIDDGLKNEILLSLKELEKDTGRDFGSVNRPLFISIRSGASTAMTGLVGSVLNLGMNDKTVEGLAKETGDKRFALDCYRRFIQMYGGIVLDIDHADFEDILEAAKLQNDYILSLIHI